MESQLQELIDKIKSEGVKSAEEQAQKIVEEAEKRADEITKKAKEKADSIIADAEKQKKQSEQSGKETLAQAGRDLLLKLQHEISELFHSVTTTEIEQKLADANLEEVIVAILKNWNKDEAGSLAVTLPEDDFSKLEKSLRSKLAEELKKGLELKPFRNVKNGFYIQEKDGSAYYNFSAEGIAENLSEMLNPRLKEIMQKAVSEG